MRTLVILGLLAGSAIAAEPPPPGPEPTFTPPRATRTKLPNGLTLIVVENHRVPVVTLRLVVPGAGSAADPRGKGGLAGFTADLLDEGSGARSSTDVARALDDLGAQLFIGVDADTAVVQLSTLARTLPGALDLLAEIVTAPRFDDAEAARVHGDRLTALTLRPDEPRLVAQDRLSAALFGPESPYGHPVDGTTDSFAKVTVADARAFYRDAWDPARAALVVAGDVDPAKLAAELTTRLGSWKRPAGKRAAPMPEGRAAPVQLVYVDRPAAEQSDVRFGTRGLDRGDARSYSWEVLVNAWGGGFTGRLTQILREKKGYLYHVYPALTFHPRGSVYEVLAPLFTPQTSAGMQEILAMIADLAKNGLPAGELAKAKLNLIRDLPDRFETNSATTAAYATLFALRLPDDWYAKYAARIGAVSSAEVAKVAQSGLKRVVFVVVGDLSKVRAPVDALGLGKAEVYGLDGKLRAAPAGR